MMAVVKDLRNQLLQRVLEGLELQNLTLHYQNLTNMNYR